MPGLLDYAKMVEQLQAGGLLGNVMPVASKNNPLDRGINPLNTTEGARPYRGGSNYYHGTNAEFSAFKPSDKGVWLTRNRADALDYANIRSRGGGKPRVLNVEHGLKKIANKSDWNAAEKASKDKSQLGVVRELKTRGFDAFEEGDGLWVFDHSALKIR
jgi:hypothetical protein